MPELPEVETIKRDLTPQIVDRMFTDVILNYPEMVLIPSPESFTRRLMGQCIKGLDRRGKYLIMRLASGEALILHFRMSGSLLFAPQDEPNAYCRAVFFLDDGVRLCFRDPRKLGKMWLVEDESVVVGRLGPEPLEPGFTPDTLAQRLSNRSAPIKALLCDQSILAGVGNLYADEALFAAGIHPLRGANRLSAEEVARLHCALRRVLEEAINSHGASISGGTWWRPDGQIGTAQVVFKVAHRSFQPCPVCTTPIERIPIRGRGSCFCPNCQNESPGKSDF